MALPTFSWGILFRYKKFNSILNNITIDELSDTLVFKRESNNYYKVKNDMQFHYDTYLRAGDEIRFENIDSKLLQEASFIANKCVNTNSLTISLFEINSDNIQHIDSINYEKVFNSFK